VAQNLSSGADVGGGAGIGVEALEPFWMRLRRSRARVLAVATDLSAAYIRVVRANLPRAVPVFDHFHVIKRINKKLSAFRRELYHQSSSESERKVLQGRRWLLHKNPENPDTDRDERQRLEEARRFSEPLAVAYYLKEDLRQIWLQPNQRAARRVLRDWLARARASDIRRLVQFAATLEQPQEGVLNYYQQRISTGPPGRHRFQNPTHEAPSLWMP
jgi:transposase